MKKRAFTLIEVIVTLAIMGVVVSMIAALAGFTAGRLKSAQLKRTNDALRSALDVIGQKMYNANDTVKIDSKDIYGFRFYNSNQPNHDNQPTADIDMLVIVSSGAPGGNKVCTFFGKNNGRLMIGQDNPCSTTAFKTPSDLTDSLTSEKIIIDDFIISADPDSKMMLDKNGSFIPKIKLTLTAHDSSDPNAVQSTLQTTFTMDGENVKNLKR